MSLVFSLVLSTPTFAQDPGSEPNAADVVAPTATSAPAVYVRGVVKSVVSEGTETQAGYTVDYQNLLIEIVQGADKGQSYTIENSTSNGLSAVQHLHAGDALVLTKMTEARGTNYYIVDNYRLPGILLVALVFFVLAAVLGRRHGVMATVGLGVSVAILAFGVAPAIARGVNPVLAVAIGSVIIAISSMLLAHSFNKRTNLALLATLVTLAIAFVLSALAIKYGLLLGTGGDENVVLQVATNPNFSLKGLLLAGMVIGVLGVLDDVTTAQVASVAEIQEAGNGQFTALELYRRGFTVGREHIASLINTLALAYVGASFPLFLLFLSAGGPPAWVVLNSESVAEEIVRALVGGASLMLAVPISTIFAAVAFARITNKNP